MEENNFSLNDKYVDQYVVGLDDSHNETVINDDNLNLNDTNMS